MLKRAIAIAAAATGLGSLVLPVEVRAAVVINEVYSGGGSSNALAAYGTDFVELYNNGPTAVDLEGYQLQYAPSSRAAGVFDVPIGTLPAGATIAPLGFFLVQTGSTGSAGATDVTPDVDFNFESGVSGASLALGAGSVRIVDDAAASLDVLGWGGLTNDNFETTPETSPADVSVSMQRAVLGVDTNNNQLDFVQLVPTPTAAIPEPAGLGMLAVGGLLALRRRVR